MQCNDPYVEMLTDYGYCTVRLPRVGLGPLTLVAQEDGGSLKLFGRLAKQLPATEEALPEIQVGRRVANLSGRHTGKFGASIGLDLLGSVAQVLGGSTLGLGLAYKSAKSLSFEFSDVLEDSASLGDLDVYMASVTPPSGLIARKYIDQGRMYVVLSTLSAKTLTVSADFSRDTKVELEAPQLHGLVTVDLGVSGEQARTWTVSYTSEQPLVFGFMAIQVVAAGGVYTVGRYADDEMAMLPGAEPYRQHLISPGSLLDLNEADGTEAEA